MTPPWSEGAFEERWELMACLHDVFVRQEIASQVRLEDLSRKFLKRFTTSADWMLRSPLGAYRVLRDRLIYLQIRREFLRGRS